MSKFPIDCPICGNNMENETLETLSDGLLELKWGYWNSSKNKIRWDMIRQYFRGEVKKLTDLDVLNINYYYFVIAKPPWKASIHYPK